MQTSLTNYYNKNKKKVSLNNKLSDKIIENNITVKNSAEEKLTNFDLDARFGPCKGISRSKRYELAVKFNLKPPQNIKKLIDQSQSEKSYYDKFI